MCFDTVSVRFKAQRNAGRGENICVKELNPVFQILFFPCSKFDKVWVKHKNLRISSAKDVGTLDCLSGREKYLGTFQHQGQN